MVADFTGLSVMVYFILLFHIVFFYSNILIPFHDSAFVLESREAEKTHEHAVLTAAYVEGVVLVQRPPSKV